MKELPIVIVEQKGYNGWKNYETWIVNLWMENDEQTYNKFLRIAKVYKRAFKPIEGTYSEEAVEFANRLDNAFDKLSPAKANVYGDLLNAALSNVEWREIAESWLDKLED